LCTPAIWPRYSSKRADALSAYLAVFPSTGVAKAIFTTQAIQHSLVKALRW
jgi:hypothetical protein